MAHLHHISHVLLRSSCSDVVLHAHLQHSEMPVLHHNSAGLVLCRQLGLLYHDCLVDVDLCLLSLRGK